LCQAKLIDNVSINNHQFFKSILQREKRGKEIEKYRCAAAWGEGRRGGRMEHGQAKNTILKIESLPTNHSNQIEHSTSKRRFIAFQKLIEKLLFQKIFVQATTSLFTTELLSQ
jgi:hypothetical protein